MLLIRIEYVDAPNKPPVLAHVADVPGQGERINIGTKSWFVQLASTIADPKPGEPVALLRVIE
jgi:hypothetical protein